jgi:hypothetical protein
MIRGTIKRKHIRVSNFRDDMKNNYILNTETPTVAFRTDNLLTIIRMTILNNTLTTFELKGDT